MNIFTEIIDEFEKLPGQIKSIFTSPAAEADLKEAATLAVAAQPYVSEVAAAMAPFLGRAGVLTLAAVQKAYSLYAVPLANVALTTPAEFGNAILNLITGLLQKNHAPAASVTVLNTAVQLAKLAVSASPTPAAA